MKKLILFVVFVISLSLLVGCGESASNSDITLATTGGEETEETTESTYSTFDAPQDSSQDIEDGNYVNVKDLYDEVTDSYIFLDAAYCDQLEIGGITSPLENNGEYYRLDAYHKDWYSYSNYVLAANTAGATVRFRTNSSTIVVDIAVREAQTEFKHMTDRGTFGIDIYTGTGSNRQYCGGLMQFMTDDTEICELIELPGGCQEVTIELPQYAGVYSVKIGFEENSKIAEPTERTNAPILFYGSSITQGACASRPGTAYTNILCRMLDADCINLGFSGSALGEQVIADYIVEHCQDISVFVMDYDNNSEVDELEANHYNFYKTVREGLKDVPIVFVSRPYYTSEPDEEEQQRQAIIKATYDKAVAEGDTNVYYISADDFFPADYADLYTVDNVHPNDLGHYAMAQTIYPVLKEILNSNN